jgi:hypothetical protein
MVTHFGIAIDTIFEPLVTVCGELGQNHVPAKVASAVLLTLCRSLSALSFIK